VIEKLVSDLKIEIDERQKEIRFLETDRNKKFGEITTAIKEHRQITEELKTSTQALSKVLSNNQSRGQWGERIIEDILRSAGLIENIHFTKQITLGNSNVKPDITLLLPNGRKVCVDVKFPYSEVQKMAESENKATKEIHLKNFSRDVKTKISEIESRGYINVAHGTLDYANMFVPNEMLFSFINQELPDVVDEAMTKKIMIVSPFTFLIVARTVREAYANFMMEQNIRKIVNHIHEFVDEWSKFKTEFDKFDDVLTRLRSQYDKLTTTRYKQMDLRLRRIEADQKGEKLLVGEKKLLKE
jgi:DNA recombination protein RmuC